MNKSQRAVLLQKTNGRCGYCGISLEGIRWHADHMEPVVRISKYERGKGFVSTGELTYPEHDHIDNMIASCPQCNILKNGFNVESFRNIVSGRIEQLERQNAYRTAKRYGMVKETGISIVFYFEQMEVHQ